jgi:ATP phosphoribosyltransferase
MTQIDIVVPDGSMQEAVTKLLVKAGLSVVIERKRAGEGRVVGVDWIKRIAFQRPQEIPLYLRDGYFDVAVVGEDWIANWGYDFPVLLNLPIGRSGNNPVKIILAVSQASGFQRLADLPRGCKIATEYVQLVQRFLYERGRLDIGILPSWGNTEHKVRFGATAIVDVTESGDSLEDNQLRIICEIMDSNTVIAANPKSLANESKRPYIDCFVRLVNGAYQASKHVMLTANVPELVLDEAGRIIGGLKGPTCSPLTITEPNRLQRGWFALQSVVPREDEQRIIFELLQIGVTDIVVNRDIPLVMS